MRVLVIVERHSGMELVNAAINRLDPWPGADVTFLATAWIGFFRYLWPDRLAASDFPHVGDVRLEPRFHRSQELLGYVRVWSRDTHPCARPVALPDVSEQLGNADTTTDMLAEMLEQADLVVAAAPPTPTSTSAVADILRETACTGRFPRRVVNMQIRSSNHDDMDRALLGVADPACPQWDHEADPLVRHADARRFFDYNFAVNAAGLLAQPLRTAGVPTTVGDRDDGAVPATHMASKFSMLLLLEMARHPGKTWTHMEILGLLLDWRGTGKSGHATVVGSPSSQHAIFSNLRWLGLIEQVVTGSVTPERAPRFLDTVYADSGQDVRFQVSDIGWRFVSLLPRGAFDPDLPFRITRWGREWPASKPDMAAWLRRSFGAIKRTNGMSDLLEGQPDVAASAASLVRSLGVDEAARAAQVTAGCLEAAAAGGDVTPGEGRGIRLAARRLDLGTLSPAG